MDTTKRVMAGTSSEQDGDLVLTPGGVGDQTGAAWLTTQLTANTFIVFGDPIILPGFAAPYTVGFTAANGPDTNPDDFTTDANGYLVESGVSICLSP